MARTRTQRINTGKGNDIVVVNQPPQAVQRRRSAPRRRSTTRRRVSRRARRVDASYGQAGLRTRMTGVAAGGFIVGFLERNWGDQIPSFPILGKKGTIAAAIYFLNPKSNILRDAGVAAAAICGNELGATGAISGVDDPYRLSGADDDGYLDDDDDDYDDDDAEFFQTA